MDAGVFYRRCCFWSQRPPLPAPLLTQHRTSGPGCLPRGEHELHPAGPASPQDGAHQLDQRNLNLSAFVSYRRLRGRLAEHPETRVERGAAAGPPPPWPCPDNKDTAASASTGLGLEVARPFTARESPRLACGTWVSFLSGVTGSLLLFFHFNVLSRQKPSGLIWTTWRNSP